MIEIRLRTLLLVIVLILVIVMGVSVARLRGTSGEVENQKAVLAPTTAVTPDKDISITFRDASEKWDWEVECRDEFVEWLGKHPEKAGLNSLTVILVDGEALEDLRWGPDARKLALGVAYPSPSQLQALAFAGCAGNDAVRCYVTIKEGSGAAVDVAVTTAVAYALERHLRPFTKDEWESFEWRWESFSPLIEKEGEQWISACLHLVSR